MTLQPRWLDRKAAALYLSVRPDQLPGLLKAGKIPQPSLQFGPRTPRWDRLKLDEVMGGMTGGKSDNDPFAQILAKLAAVPYKTREDKARFRAQGRLRRRP